MLVREQTGGTFSGFVAVEGGNDKQCTNSFGFTAEMTQDGAITSFRRDTPFVTPICRPASDATYAGTASSTLILVQMKDRATCVDDLGRPKDVNRTFTISVTRRSVAMSAD